MVPEIWKKIHAAHLEGGLIAEEVSIGSLDWDPRRWCGACKAANDEALVELPEPMQIEVTITEVTVRQGNTNCGGFRQLDQPGTVFEIRATKDEGEWVEVLSPTETKSYLKGFRAGAVMAGCLEVKEKKQ